MSKRYCYPNKNIFDKRLPFIIQITAGLIVYYQKLDSNQLFKADSIFQKKIGRLTISIDDYTIIVNSWKKNDYIIKHKGVELENIKSDK